MAAIQKEEKRLKTKEGKESTFTTKANKLKKCKHCGRTKHKEAACYTLDPCNICGGKPHKVEFYFKKKKEIITKADK